MSDSGDYLMAHEKVTRVEVIDETGRVYVRYGATNVVTALQDNGRTLKVFLNVEEESYSLLVGAHDRG